MDFGVLEKVLENSVHQIDSRVFLLVLDFKDVPDWYNFVIIQVEQIRLIPIKILGQTDVKSEASKTNVLSGGK